MEGEEGEETRMRQHAISEGSISTARNSSAGLWRLGLSELRDTREEERERERGRERDRERVGRTRAEREEPDRIPSKSQFITPKLLAVAAAAAAPQGKIGLCIDRRIVYLTSTILSPSFCYYLYFPNCHFSSYYLRASLG
ncbi:hypothetical protein ABZX51_007463 [Aspergillus tubingensis]